MALRAPSAPAPLPTLLMTRRVPRVWPPSLPRSAGDVAARPTLPNPCRARAARSFCLRCPPRSPLHMLQSSRTSRRTCVRTPHPPSALALRTGRPHIYFFRLFGSGRRPLRSAARGAKQQGQGRRQCEARRTARGVKSAEAGSEAVRGAARGARRKISRGRVGGSARRGARRAAQNQQGQCEALRATSCTK